MNALVCCNGACVEGRKCPVRAAMRLEKLAEEAEIRYNEETHGGGEPVYPAWIDDVRIVVEAMKVPAALPKNEGNIWPVIAGLILLIILFLASSKPAQAADVWLNLNVASHHFSEKRFNENNLGLGIECTRGDWLVMAGKFNNSLGYPSRYAVAGWMPVRYDAVSLGILAGAIDGYPKMNDGKVGPGVALLAQVSGKHVGANIMVLPPIMGAPMTAGLQLRFKFW